MLSFPAIHPVALNLGPIQVHWYGLMYVLGFTAAWFLAKRSPLYHLESQSSLIMSDDTLADLFSYMVVAIVCGGRLGYMLVYKSVVLWENPLRLFAVWEGGMSFHGGLLGVAIGLLVFSRCYRYRFADLVDFAAPLAIPGLGLGRIGNFINGELWGRVTDVPWAMVFPNSDGLPRHPSQLYEMLGEGVLLFLLVYWHQRQSGTRSGTIAAWFVCHYAWIRFCVEFYREPDFDMGFVWLQFFTMGQVLCLWMFFLSMGWLCYYAMPFRRRSVKPVVSI